MINGIGLLTGKSSVNKIAGNNMKKNNSTLVYSTDKNRLKQNEEQNEEVKTQGTVYLQRQSKGRAGKTVTVIKGLTGNLKAWKKEFQQICGAGGTVKNELVEIQGDHRQKIAQYLNKKEIKTKFSGG